MINLCICLTGKNGSRKRVAGAIHCSAYELLSIDFFLSIEKKVISVERSSAHCDWVSWTSMIYHQIK
jgi:hypothetical protein